MLTFPFPLLHCFLKKNRYNFIKQFLNGQKRYCITLNTKVVLTRKEVPNITNCLFLPFKLILSNKVELFQFTSASTVLRGSEKMFYEDSDALYQNSLSTAFKLRLSSHCHLQHLSLRVTWLIYYCSRRHSSHGSHRGTVEKGDFKRNYFILWAVDELMLWCP